MQEKKSKAKTSERTAGPNVRKNNAQPVRPSIEREMHGEIAVVTTTGPDGKRTTRVEGPFHVGEWNKF